ncbi:ROK family protein [Kineococcus sp. SYSU DK003]|uniref:ROK family protein n=1 Tax=Kineococcus sp. SYSU DK003 TaxID=3383124 RepID=UPI003D7D39AD
MARLTSLTGLSRRTVELILSDLVSEGLVEEVAPVAGGVTGGVGRPPRAYQFLAESVLLAAVQIDTASVQAALTDVRGRILARERRELRDYYDPQSSLGQAVDVMNSVIVTSRRPVSRVRVGGVASGGTMDSQGRVLSLVNAPAWVGVSPAEALSGSFPFPFAGDNDVNLAALAERAVGAAVGEVDFTWLLAGMRASAGIVIRGEVHRGFQGAAGEIVHAPTLGLVSLEDHPLGLLSSPLRAQQEEALATFQAARAGDPGAQALVDEFVTPVAAVLQTFAWTLAPPVVVLGGAMAEVADVLVPRLAERLRAAGAPPVRLRPSALGQDWPLLGAIQLARTRAEDELTGAGT